MKNRKAYIETLILTIIGCFFIMPSVLPPHFDVLNLIFNADLLAGGSNVKLLVMTSYGIVFVTAAIFSFFLIRYRTTTLSARCVHAIHAALEEVSDTWTWLCKTTGVMDNKLWLLCMLAVGAAVRCYFLAQPMWYDESYSFLNFVNGSLSDLFSYSNPNNHVLHTLLVKISVEVLGSHPVAIRLPAFIAGFCVIPLTFCLARLISQNSRSGFLACGLAAVYPYLVLYDTMARGYSLLILLSLLLVVLCFRLIERPSIRLCSLISLIIALGFWDIPSFLFPATGIFLWTLVMLIQHGKKPRWIFFRVLMPCAVMTTALTGLFYTPTIIVSQGMIDTIVSQGSSYQEFIHVLPTHILETVKDFTRFIPVGILVIAISLLAVGVYWLIREKRWRSMTILLVLMIGSAVFFSQTIPLYHSRTWIYFLPFIFALIDAGFISVLRYSNILVRGILLFLAGVSAVLLMNYNVISSWPGSFPEASFIVKALAKEIKQGDEVLTNSDAYGPVQFYLWYYNVFHNKNSEEVNVKPKKYFIVQTKYSHKDLNMKDAQKIMDLGDSQVYVSELMIPGSAEDYNRRGIAFAKRDQYQRAYENFNEAIRLKPDSTLGYKNRGIAYLTQGNNDLGCSDLKKSCALGDCNLLEDVKRMGYCR